MSPSCSIPKILSLFIILTVTIFEQSYNSVLIRDVASQSELEVESDSRICIVVCYVTFITCHKGSSSGESSFGPGSKYRVLIFNS